MKIRKCDTEKQAVSGAIVKMLVEKELSYSEAIEVLEIAQNQLKDCKVAI